VSLFGKRQSGATASHDPEPADEAARWNLLARRIEQGEPSAEAELADLFHQRVKVFASVRLHGSDAASDVAQDTIVAVIEALRGGRLHEPFNLPGFVLGTARNLVNNYHRRAARNAAVIDEPPERPDVADAGQLNLEAERRTLVRKALLGLNRLDRRILLLTLVEGMHPREIAPIVGLKPEVVRTRKARAVRDVAEEIGRATRNSQPDHVDTSGLKK
jgi:RNA polymerase sigma-70 factor (ECF subfamily)